MDIETWRDQVNEHAYYRSQGDEAGLTYAVLGLAGEAGEVADQLKKKMRDGKWSDDRIDKIFYELGDVMWYAMRVCEEMGWDMEDVLDANYDKLKKRHAKS